MLSVPILAGKEKKQIPREFDKFFCRTVQPDWFDVTNRDRWRMLSRSGRSCARA